MATLLDIKSVIQIGLTTIRVTYSLDPLMASTTGTNDSLNPTNYSLSPTTNSIDSIESVSGDPTSVDLQLTLPLSVGTWTIVVSNVKTPTGISLGIANGSFDAVALLNQESVSKGARGLTAEDVLRELLNPALQGPAWDALVAALATGDQYLWNMAAAAFDQLYPCSARGKYLDKRMSDLGILRPENVGMSDETFSDYGISINAEKVSQQAVLNVLEVFYGLDAVRAHSITSQPAPFALNNLDDLQLTIDGKNNYAITFNAADFINIASATAVETSLAITRSLRLQGDLRSFAFPYLSPGGNSYVKIYSGSLGLGGSIRIIGGRGQLVLQFPSLLSTYTSGPPLPIWTVTRIDARNVIRFSMGGSNLSLLPVSDQDYVCIYGIEFNVNNRGSFPISAVGYIFAGNNGATPPIQWFEVENQDGVAEGPITQVANASVLFFSPDLKTIHTAVGRTVVASQGSGRIRCLLPATTQAVNRGPLLAAYPSCPTPLSVTSLVRDSTGLVTCTTATPHGLLAGDQVIVDGATCDLTPPALHAGNPGLIPATANACIMSVISPLKATSGSGLADFGFAKMNDGRILFVGGYDSTGSALRNIAEIYIPSGYNVLTDGAIQAKYDYFVSSPYPTAVKGLTCQNIPSLNKVLAVGGHNGAIVIADAYLYNPLLDSWVATGSLNVARYFQTSTFVSNIILVSGGEDSTSVTIGSCEKYTPGTGLWTITGSLAMTRAFHTQTTLASGKVLITGGYSDDIGGYTNTCEIYDPGTGTWSFTGGMALARAYHIALLLSDGRVLVVGGIGLVNIKDAEIYDPETGRWSLAGRTSILHEVALGWYDSGRNKVYVGGGYWPILETYDVATGVWSKSFSTPSARLFSQAIVVDSVSTFLCGGYDPLTWLSPQIHQVAVPGAEIFMDGELNGIFEVKTQLSGTKFTYQTNRASYSSATGNGITAIPMASIPCPVGAPGPYIFDPANGISVTSIETTLTQSIARRQYNSINVVDATIFPDVPGWLCLAFGTKNATYPVHYLGRLSGTALRIDFETRFQKDIPNGSKVTLLNIKGPEVPLHPEDIGAFYLTGSPAGRIAASDTIDRIIAAGYEVDKGVVYPGDRGLAGEGLPQVGVPRIADKVNVWSGDSPDAEVKTAREE